MSKSLTINAPQIVQTRNTLNAVPSGSTAEPDENVKFVPQDLTEEQQAQARQNIGAGEPQIQADWNQTDTTAKDYIKNKPESFGGSAPELDGYFTIYPSGDTTLSAEAGSIDEVWMDGSESTAQGGVYSLNANSVVRVKAANNVCFNFSNTTDEIWVYVPKGIVLSEPIYGTRPNVNLVYWNISANAQTMNFGGILWLMTNRLFNTMFDNSVLIVFNDTEPINATGVTIETTVGNMNGYACVSVYKKYELASAVSAAGSNVWGNLKQKGGSYGYLVQEGYKLVRKELPCVVDDCLQLTYSNIGESIIRILKNDVGGYCCGMSIDYMYQGSKPCHYRYVSNVNDLKEGEYCWNYGGSWTINYKPYSTNTTKNTTLYIKLYDVDNTWSRHNCTSTCNGIIFPSRVPLPDADNSYAMSYCDFSKLNNTVIFPEWKNGTYGGGPVQKVVCLNKSLTSAGYVSGATEYIFTNTSVPGSVFSAVQESNVTKVWLPRATYDLAVVDANWSAYASKLFPYDFLTFGPDNYVVPVALNTVSLTMTDANNTVIAGDFVAENITITPSV